MGTSSSPTSVAAASVRVTSKEGGGEAKACMGERSPWRTRTWSILSLGSFLLTN